MFLRLLPIFFCAFVISTSIHAHDYQLGTLHIDHPYARATVVGQANGGVFLSVENTGKEGDKLISVNSPVAKAAELHNMTMEDNVMKMRAVNDIELKPMTTVAMKPGGGYHIMLIGLTQPLTAGDIIPLTLSFQKAGKIQVQAHVMDKNDTPLQRTHHSSDK